jgi:uncharacterized protein (TIGR02001 family)
MRTVRIAVALGCLGAAAAAHAEFSATVTGISDYDFRGASQTKTDPAIQGSVDYAHESGWYIGAWATNVDFGDNTDYEIDLYTGFSGETGNGMGWDAGLIYYTYEDSDLNYPEIYGGLSYSWFSGKLYYSNDFAASDESAWYLTGDASFPLPANVSLNLHLGYNFGDFWDAIDSDYLDYSVGVGYTLGHFDLSLKYVDTSLSRGDYWFSSDDLFNTEGRVIFGVSTSFPWGE